MTDSSIFALHDTSPGERRAVQMVVGIVDLSSFTRDCIALSMERLGIEVRQFATVEEVAQTEEHLDVLLFHLHSAERTAHHQLGGVVHPAPLVVLGSGDDAEAVRAAFEYGVRGYVPTTTTSLDLLLDILRLVKAGGSFIPLSILSRPEIGRNDTGRLTQRELLVLERMTQGKPNKIIAYELQMSESTVKVHIASILKKTNSKNRTEAVSQAFSMQLLASSESNAPDRQRC